METTGIEFRRMRAAELAGWADFMREAKGGEPPDRFERRCLDDPDGDPEGVMLALSGGKIISSCRVAAREIYLSGRRVKMGAVGDVCTHPDFRRRGVAGQLLGMAGAYMKERGMSVSMLFTDIPEFYRAHGYFAVPRFFGRATLRRERLDGEIRPFMKQDAAAVRGIYSLFAGRYSGLILREHPLYWENFVFPRHHRPVVLIRDGRVAAYMDYEMRSEAEIFVREYAALPGEDALLGMMAHFAGAGTAPRPFMGRAEEIIREDGMMARLNEPFSLDGRRIDGEAALAALLADPVFFPPDGF